MLYSVLYTHACIMGTTYTSMYMISYWLLLFLWASNYECTLWLLYILLLVTKGKRCCWYHCESCTGCFRCYFLTLGNCITCIIFDFVECITGSNVVLDFNDKHGWRYSCLMSSCTMWESFFCIRISLAIE